MKNEECIKLENHPVFSKNIIILLLSIALIGTVGYIFYERIQHDKDIEIGDNTIDKLERSRELLKQELRITRSDYDVSKALVRMKNANIKERDHLIFEKQKMIQNILNQNEISTKDLKKAGNLILSLKSDLGEYKREIEILEIQNSRLKKNNSSLLAKNKSILDQNVTIQNNLQSEKNARETDKIEVNSTLSISNYNLVGLNVKNSGKEVETGRAKRIDKLNISFDVDPNLNALTESKELFIAIYLPNGELGKFEGANNGTISLRSGKSVEYSDRIIFNYDPNKLNPISFSWKGYNFNKGEYKIDIYSNGFKVAQRTLKLK